MHGLHTHMSSHTQSSIYKFTFASKDGHNHIDCNLSEWILKINKVNAFLCSLKSLKIQRTNSYIHTHIYYQSIVERTGHIIIKCCVPLDNWLLITVTTKHQKENMSSVWVLLCLMKTLNYSKKKQKTGLLCRMFTGLFILSNLSLVVARISSRRTGMICVFLPNKGFCHCPPVWFIWAFSDLHPLL